MQFKPLFIIAALLASSTAFAEDYEFHRHSPEVCAAFGDYAEALQSGRQYAPTLSSAIKAVQAGNAKAVAAGKKTKQEAAAMLKHFSAVASVVYSMPASKPPSEINDYAVMLCSTDTATPEMLGE